MAARTRLPALLRGLRGLEAAGCGLIAIPCNTAHGWFAPLMAEAHVPILHIVEAAREALELQRVPPGPIGLLGTAATLEMGLYQQGIGPRMRGRGCRYDGAAGLAGDRARQGQSGR
jgi:aspartate racemase